MPCKYHKKKGKESTKGNNLSTILTCKHNLTDLTFLVPLRIESVFREENINTSINYLLRHFNSRIIVLEADKEQKYYPRFKSKLLQYKFIQDNSEIYRKTRWINQLINMADTAYVAVWDVDAIAPPEQVVESVINLRSGKYAMSFPYDGKFYACDKITSDIYKKIPDIKVLTKRIPVMRLVYSYHCIGGAFLINKQKYLLAGGENENFIGWGPEDFEHVKRMEILDLGVHYTKGPLFHLWHPRGKNSWYANRDIEIHNRKELLRTCKTQLP